MIEQGNEVVYLLRGVTEEQMTRLLRGIVPEMVWADTIIIHEGATDDDMYVILEGSVRVFTGFGTSAQREFGDRLVGEMVGEVNFMNGGARSATVVANENSLVLRFERAHIWDEMQADQALAAQLAWNIARVLAERLRTTTAQVGHSYLRVMSDTMIARFSERATDLDAR